MEAKPLEQVSEQLGDDEEKVEAAEDGSLADDTLPREQKGLQRTGSGIMQSGLYKTAKADILAAGGRGRGRGR